MRLNLFKKSLKKSFVIKRGDYKYFVNPITDGIPEVKPELLDEVVNEIKRKIEKFGFFDKLVTLEAMGIPLVTLLSQRLKKPFVIIRKRPYFFDDEITVGQKTGYSDSKLFINGLKKDDKVVIVDDVLSTGGSLTAVLNALKSKEVVVKGVVLVVDKGLVAEKISKKFNVDVEFLVKIKIKGNSVKIL